MARGLKIAFPLALALVIGVAAADPQHEEHGGGRPAAHPAEPHPGPSGYQRVEAPHGWDNRPATADRGAYQHNFQAQRSFRIGPYHRPPGWTARRWGYGEILPRAFWGPQYLLADYWLFALEVPPVGYEWVRYGADALLVNTGSGEILQVEYGVFA
ncbi:MAG: RcnB family protein [Steroidobacteraceae bacterium]|jgi:Ni/Co efflux regulator RcnB